MSDEVERPKNETELHTVRVVAVVPMVQALLTGAVISIFVFALALTFGWDRPFIWMLWGFLLPLVGLWSFSTYRWFNLTALIQKVERATNIDLPGGGEFFGKAEGEKKPVGVTVTVRDIRDGGSLSVYKYHFEMIDAEQLLAFAKVVSAGGTLAVDMWSGSGRPFSKPQFMAFRSELIKRGWVVMKNGKSKNQGFELSRAGAAVMREIVRELSPHSPTEEDFGEDA